MPSENSVIVVVPMKPDENGERMPFFRSTYENALRAVGLRAIAVLTNMKYVETARLFEQAAGLMLIGGSDIEPVLYNQKALASTEPPDRDRDRIEGDLARKAYRAGKPVLGICRGIQIMAVALGGGLNQQLDGHRTAPAVYENLELPEAHHEIVLMPGSLIHGIFGGRPENRRIVNSMHHQAVSQPALPEFLWASAYSTIDGTTEAVEALDHPFYLGVQWHPEAEFDANRQLFERFAQAVMAYGRKS